MFNGTITNYADLIRVLSNFGGVDVGGVNYDALVLAHYMRELLVRLGVDDGIRELFRTVRGGYSIIAIWRDSLVVIRDPWGGFRPLAIGSDGNGIAIASESAALEALGMAWREVEPGKASCCVDQAGGSTGSTVPGLGGPTAHLSTYTSSGLIPSSMGLAFTRLGVGSAWHWPVRRRFMTSTS